ncbi:hypothetical protein HY624_03000 [Candidatus Uhrbacteria bacterium]|nr:hypothetical protein [Candidatus Uhrbacteria bacterium]
MFCPECAPTHQVSHVRSRIDSALTHIVERTVIRIVPRTIERLVQRIIIGNLLRVMRFLRIIREQPLTPDRHIHQRTRVVAAEAEKRGFRVTVLTIGKFTTNLFRMYTPERTYTFEGLPGLDPATTATNIDNKEEARRLFTVLGAPTPKGKSFMRAKPALAYAATIGFPLVVKPQHGSLSAHTTVNIQTEEELLRAIVTAQHVSRGFVVEEYIPGSLFRATTVGPRLIACGRRDPPFMIGDGVQTVEALFQSRDVERRALLVALGYTPKTIPALPQSHMRVDPTTVLAKGERVAVTWKINLSYGATVTDVTDEVHPDNRVLFERIAASIDLPCLGIDFIAPSIAVSWKEQRCAFIELNSLPSIDLHHAPIIQGTPRNVAGALLDYVVPSF